VTENVALPGVRHAFVNGDHDALSPGAMQASAGGCSAAPIASTMAAVAIPAGDFGGSGRLPAVSPQRVTAQVMTGLRFNTAPAL